MPTSPSAFPRLRAGLPHVRLGTGILVTGLALTAVGAATHSSLLAAPFAATAALQHAAPYSPAARPRNVVGGYVVGAGVGAMTGLALGSGGAAPLIAAALAAMLMLALDVEHPPAVAMAVIAGQVPTLWAVEIAAVGAVTMAVTTVALAPALHRRRDPADGVAGREVIPPASASPARVAAARSR